MFGYIVLYSFPLVVLILFRRLDKPKALVASILAGYLLLPEQLMLDLPLLPTLNKHTIPVLTAFFVLLAFKDHRTHAVLPGWIPKSRLSRSFIVVLLAGALATAQTNGDTIVINTTILPGLSIYDGVSLILAIAVSILPFILARKFLAYPEQQRLVLSALVVAGGLYSFLALYEVRMSPQLNNIIFGFFPHSFLQHVRGDGYRPIVFLNHGLWLSIFLAMCCLAAVSLFRVSQGATRAKYLLIGGWLFLTLVLTKSLGAFIITLCLLPVIFLSRRIHLIVASTVAMIVILYPMLRGSGLLPLEPFLDWAYSVDFERGHSLEYRLTNEEILLEKANERPSFGWGIWGRSFVYDETGREISVTDGYWIIILGVGGWIRYVAEFGLLCLPLLIMVMRKDKYELGPETTLLSLLMTANLVDLIPNATITPITWMIAGALWGRIELGRIVEEEGRETVSAMGQRRVRYSRYSDLHGPPKQEGMRRIPAPTRRT